MGNIRQKRISAFRASPRKLVFPQVLKMVEESQRMGSGDQPRPLLKGAEIAGAEVNAEPEGDDL